MAESFLIFFDNAKGTLFFISESVFTATAITTLILFEKEKKSNGTFANSGRAEGLRAAFFGSVGIAAGLAIWGIIDAVYEFKSRHPQSSQQIQFQGTQISYVF